LIQIENEDPTIEMLIDVKREMDLVNFSYLGQQQRVAIARSLANTPEVILADEPTGNLDSSTGSRVMDFLKKLHKEKGTTIVMVTHDRRVAEEADRVELLRDGTIVKNDHNSKNK